MKHLIISLVLFALSSTAVSADVGKDVEQDPRNMALCTIKLLSAPPKTGIGGSIENMEFLYQMHDGRVLASNCPSYLTDHKTQVEWSLMFADLISKLDDVEKE